MNSGGREPRENTPYSVLTFDPVAPHRNPNPGRLAKLVRMAGLGICMLFTLLSLVLLYQSSHIKAEVVKQRLLEVSLQDLVVQSTALRHIDRTHAYQTRMNLEQQGYGSTVELMNQLAARLAVIEAIEGDEQLAEHAGVLRERLLNLDLAINGKQGDSFTAVDQWFSGLAQLNSAASQFAATSENQARNLHLHIGILTFMVLLICGGLTGKILWDKSPIGQRLNSKRQQMESESMIDPLTGLLNAQAWLRMCEMHLKNSSAARKFSSSLAIVNIDYFKQYCDTYGHAAGDSRLSRFADLLKSNFRPSDLIARVGEHEFAVLLPACKTDDAHRIIERMRNSQHHAIAFSAGVCDIDHSQSVSHTMAVADQALCEARKRQVAA